MTSLFVLFGWPLFVNGLELDAPCFFPNGSISANFRAGNDTKGTNLYKPCNLGFSASMCCRPTDECRHDGLCNSRFDGLAWRGMCTDPTWESDECLKICINGTGNDAQKRSVLRKNYSAAFIDVIFVQFILPLNTTM